MTERKIRTIQGIVLVALAVGFMSGYWAAKAGASTGLTEKQGRHETHELMRKKALRPLHFDSYDVRRCTDYGNVVRCKVILWRGPLGGPVKYRCVGHSRITLRGGKIEKFVIWRCRPTTKVPA